jgi:hypothetical protein
LVLAAATLVWNTVVADKEASALATPAVISLPGVNATDESRYL